MMIYWIFDTAIVTVELYRPSMECMRFVERVSYLRGRAL